MAQLSFHSPVGDLTLGAEEGKIVSLDWGWSPMSQETPLLKKAKQQIDGYFKGLNPEFTLPLAPHGTDFQRRTWKIMLSISYGKTMTYGEISDMLRTHPRAVGAACGRNPIPIIIPCHRVMGKGDKLTGFSGGKGIETKKFLLKLES